MTKSSSTSNKALFLAVLMAVSIPSASLAWDNENDPDSTLTVNVDMGSEDAGDGNGEGDGDSGCTGFATMELSATTLRSRPERVQPAVSAPNIQQRLEALAATDAFIPVNLNDTFSSGNGQERVLTRSSEVTGSWVINPNWLTPEENLSRWIFAEALVGPNLLDLWNAEEELIITPETPSLAMVDRRTYITSPFTVSFDATTCESDSRSTANIDIERSNLEAFLTVDGMRSWTPVELEVDDSGDYPSMFNPTSIMALARDGEFRGFAYMLKSRTRSDGDSNTSFIAYDVYNSDGSANETGISGESGTAELRAITKLYGELSQNAQLRTQYGFWLEVYPYGD